MTAQSPCRFRVSKRNLLATLTSPSLMLYDSPDHIADVLERFVVLALGYHWPFSPMPFVTEWAEQQIVVQSALKTN